MNTPSINKTPVKFIRIRQTIERSGLTRTSLYRKMSEGLFVPTIPLGERSCAHIESEVNTILTAMAAEKTPEELKNIVKCLVEQRQQTAA
jgi:prophage regulatory protein